MAITPTNYHRLESSELRHAHGAKPLGATDESEKLTVTIVLRRRPDGPPIPEPAHYLRTPPSERRRMPQPAFAARYGAEPGEIEKVVAFALGHGLRVDETNAARRTVVVSGTVGQFNKAFNVTLHDYEHQVRRSPRSAPQIEAYRGYDGFIHVPNDLAEIIVGVFGLDNRRITKRNAADPPSTSPIPMSTMPGLPIKPPGRTDYSDLFRGGCPGKRHHCQFGASPPSVLSISVDASNNGFPDFETTQDVFIAASVAPGAQIAVYFTTYS